LTTSQKKELRKSFWSFFGPFWRIFDKNSAANLFGHINFLQAPFELCGRKFGQLATLNECELELKELTCIGLDAKKDNNIPILETKTNDKDGSQNVFKTTSSVHSLMFTVESGKDRKS
jgi:hypothetical protein